VYVCVRVCTCVSLVWGSIYRPQIMADCMHTAVTCTIVVGICVFQEKELRAYGLLFEKH